MVSSALQLVFVIFSLVLGAAFEELLPKTLGVGVPVLLSVTSFMAVRCRSEVAVMAFAILAGALEDALSSLPPMTSVSFFLAVAFLVRFIGCLGPVLALAYPVYQVWLAIWISGIGSGVFVRVLLACPIGCVTVFVVDAALNWLYGKAAVDERG